MSECGGPGAGSRAVDTAQPARTPQRLRRRRWPPRSSRRSRRRRATTWRSYHRFGWQLLRRRGADQPQPARRGGDARPLPMSLRLFDAVRTCPRPVIAAVNGAAAGGGNELVVACDLAVAARSATFGQTGPRIGPSPVTGATNVMGVQIGEKRAKELAHALPALPRRAWPGMGLVNEVVDDDALEETVEAGAPSSPRSALATSRSPRSAPTCGGTPRATPSRTAWACSSRRSAVTTCARAPRRSWRSGSRDSRTRPSPDLAYPRAGAHRHEGSCFGSDDRLRRLTPRCQHCVGVGVLLG